MINLLELRNILTIDISRSNIRVLYGKIQNDELYIKEKFNIQWNQTNDKTIETFQYLKNKIKIMNIKFSRVYLILDDDNFLIEKLPIPYYKEKDKNKFLKNRYKYSKNLNEENYILRWMDIGYNLKIEQNEIITIGIKKDVVHYYSNLIKDLDMIPYNLGLRLNSYVKYFNYKEQINYKYKFTNLNILNIRIEDTYTELGIIKKTKICFKNTFSYYFDTNFINQLNKLKNVDRLKFSNNTEALENLNNWMKIVEISIDVFIRENKEDINLITVSGILDNFKGLNNYLSKEFNIKTIILEDKNKKKDISDYITNIGELNLN